MSITKHIYRCNQDWHIHHLLCHFFLNHGWKGLHSLKDMTWRRVRSLSRLSAGGHRRVICILTICQRRTSEIVDHVLLIRPLSSTFHSMRSWKRKKERKKEKEKVKNPSTIERLYSQENYQREKLLEKIDWFFKKESIEIYC